MKSGSILLHDPSAIGLQAVKGQIGLYPFKTQGWMSGLYLTVDSRHYRLPGETSGNMSLLSTELQIPGPGSDASADYTGKVEGWDYYKTSSGIDLYRPSVSHFLPDYTDNTHFAWTGAYGEAVPYFYFGWGTRTQKISGVGYSKWTNTAYLGLNYPIPDSLRPGWENVPPQSELLQMMAPHIPEGVWRFRVQFGSFDVDDGVAAKSYISINVRQGRKRFYRGSIDYVSETDYLIGEDDADLSGLQWATSSQPGALEVIDGDAAGAVFEVIDVFHTDFNDPPPDLPGGAWIIRTSAGNPSLHDLGMKPGDRYMLTSQFFSNIYMPFKEYLEYSPGHHAPDMWEVEFQPLYL